MLYLFDSAKSIGTRRFKANFLINCFFSYHSYSEEILYNGVREPWLENPVRLLEFQRMTFSPLFCERTYEFEKVPNNLLSRLEKKRVEYSFFYLRDGCGYFLINRIKTNTEFPKNKEMKYLSKIIVNHSKINDLQTR